MKKNISDKNLSHVIEKKFKQPKIINEGTKIINDILNDKNIPEKYKKNIVNVPIKFDNKINTKEIKLKTKPVNNQNTINKIEDIINESFKNIQNLKEEIKIDSTTSKLSSQEYLLIKSELIKLKTINEIYRFKSEFYEKIFYSAKHVIDNFNNQSIVDLKNKLNDIFYQNNHNYYEAVSKISVPCEDNNNIINIEKSLNRLMVEINETIKNKVNLNNLNDSLIITLKEILSVYIFNKNYNMEFRNKSKFFIENEENYNKLEMKKRRDDIIMNFKDYIENSTNLCKKSRTEFIEEIKTIINFYENQLIIINNKVLKSSDEIRNVENKSNNLKKLIENFIIYSDNGMKILNELILLNKNQNLKIGHCLLASSSATASRVNRKDEKVVVEKIHRFFYSKI